MPHPSKCFRFLHEYLFKKKTFYVKCGTILNVIESADFLRVLYTFAFHNLHIFIYKVHGTARRVKKYIVAIDCIVNVRMIVVP